MAGSRLVLERYKTVCSNRNDAERFLLEWLDKQGPVTMTYSNIARKMGMPVDVARNMLTHMALKELITVNDSAQTGKIVIRKTATV